MFKGHQFDQSAIWRIAIDHTTGHGWTVHYAPLLLERFKRRKLSVIGKWHID